MRNIKIIPLITFCFIIFASQLGSANSEYKYLYYLLIFILALVNIYLIFKNKKIVAMMKSSKIILYLIAISISVLIFLVYFLF